VVEDLQEGSIISNPEEEAEGGEEEEEMPKLMATINQLSSLLGLKNHFIMTLVKAMTAPS
jgi:hypothetical protein